MHLITEQILLLRANLEVRGQLSVGVMVGTYCIYTRTSASQNRANLATSCKFGGQRST